MSVVCIVEMPVSSRYVRRNGQDVTQLSIPMVQIPAEEMVGIREHIENVFNLSESAVEEIVDLIHDKVVEQAVLELVRAGKRYVTEE